MKDPAPGTAETPQGISILLSGVATSPKLGKARTPELPRHTRIPGEGSAHIGESALLSFVRATGKTAANQADARNKCMLELPLCMRKTCTRPVFAFCCLLSMARCKMDY